MKCGVRKSEYDIHAQFLQRVSYRSFSDEKLTHDELMSLFEAARWAPSSYNNQPWRFVYARSTDAAWSDFHGVLVDFNKQWCIRADTLIVVIVKTTFEYNNKISSTAFFDVGAAWMSLALEATRKGFVAHAMEGFHKQELNDLLGLKPPYEAHVMIALGKRGELSHLSPELQEQECNPSDRKPMDYIVFREKFNPQS